MKIILSSFLLIFIILMPVFSSNYKIHYLKEGETLWKLSKTYNISLKELCDLNKIKDTTKVKKGAKIKVPVESVSVTIRTKETVKKQNEKLDVVKKIDPVEKSENKNYLNFSLPLIGSIIPFVTSHFRGLIIFSEGNDNIVSIDDGEVSYIDNVYGYGNTVIIRHKNDYISSYSGFSEVYVKKGNTVKKNEVIGSAGNLSRYKKNGILFSMQYKEESLKFDMAKKRFFIN
jgi:hypothetical protein